MPGLLDLIPDNSDTLLLALVWGIERTLKMLKHRGTDLSRVARQTDRLETRWNDDTKEVIVGKIDSLYKLHDVRGEDGVPVWYVRAADQRALNDALKAMVEATKAQTAVLQKLAASMDSRALKDEAAHDAILREVKGE